MSKLILLPHAGYTGNKNYDPYFLYHYPVIGNLYRKRVELCLDELTGGRRILEIGFGAGLTFLNLRESYQEIWGLDLTADVSAISKQFSELQLDTHLQNGNVLKMPYEDNFFDSVLLISILEHIHVDEQEVAHKEIYRVLKPGGQMVYGVPVERRMMVFLFRLLGYNIRQHHFSTHDDVSAVAERLFRKVKIYNMRAFPSFLGNVYQVGHFVKE